MKEKISTKQMAASIGAFIIASSLLTREVYAYLEQEAWIAIVLGIVSSALVMQIYRILAERFPGKSLIEINDAIFGRVLGKVVSGSYVFYFLSLAVLNTRDMGDFVKSVVLPKTPMAITLIMFILICAWALNTGMKNLTSFGALLVAVAVIAIIVNALLLVKQMDMTNFLPIFTMPAGNYFFATDMIATMPFCEVIVFMMLLPDMNKPEDFGKMLKGGLIIGGVALLMIVFRDISVLGTYVSVSSMPSYAVLRLINIGDILTRLEIVYAVILISLLFFKVSILYYAAVTSFSRLLHLKSYRFLILIFGALIVIYAMGVFKSNFEHNSWQRHAAATYSTFFLLVLPGLTLLVAAIRKLLGKKKPKPV